MKNLLTREDADLSRPYERCLLYGPSSLSDQELLAVIIRSGTKGASAVFLADQILHLESGNTGLLGICHLSVSELMAVPGIGQVKAIQLKCVGELAKRISTYRARQVLSFSAPETIADYYMERLRHEETESLVCMMLDTKNGLISEEILSKGTVNYAVMSTRELFIAALRCRAVSIILLHNHPSGDPAPSDEDIRLTHRVYTAGQLIGINLLDHIIIGDNCYISFNECGILIPGEDYDHT